MATKLSRREQRESREAGYKKRIVRATVQKLKPCPMGMFGNWDFNFYDKDGKIVTGILTDRAGGMDYVERYGVPKDKLERLPDRT